MMIKYFCDECNKEAQENIPSYWVKEVTTIADASGKAAYIYKRDICDECAEKMYEERYLNYIRR